MMRLLLLAVLSFPLVLTSAAGGDWSRFRGPNGTGVGEGSMPAIDPAKPLWKVEIPGRGAGSPIVIGGKVFVQTAALKGDSRSLVCINAADGKVLWKKDMAGTSAKPHVKNSYASSTPTSDGKNVYCAWWDGSGVSLHAYDMEGQQLWRESLGGYVSQHGPGMSPMVHEGTVFVSVDDDERAELVAFDAQSGQKKWQVTRKPYRASYSTPFILKQDGKPAELIMGTTTAITSYNPATGAVNWNFDLPWNGKKQLRVVGSPIFTNGLIVMSSGDGDGSRYMIAVKVDGKAPVKAWELNRDTCYVPCMLAKGDLLFWLSDKVGYGCCAEAKTGKVLWNERVFGKEVTSSPVLIGDKILAVGEDGEVVILKAGREFEEVAKVKLKEGVYASPAVADGKVFIRGTNHLFCFGK